MHQQQLVQQMFKCARCYHRMVSRPISDLVTVQAVRSGLIHLHDSPLIYSKVQNSKNHIQEKLLFSFLELFLERSFKLKVSTAMRRKK